jgi:hypothetical protein
MIPFRAPPPRPGRRSGSPRPSQQTSCGARSSWSAPSTGCCRTGCPHRLERNADEQLAMAEAQPSGVRLVLRTRATALELDVLPPRRFTRAPRPVRTACTTCSSTGSWPVGPA